MGHVTQRFSCRDVLSFLRPVCAAITVSLLSAAMLLLSVSRSHALDEKDLVGSWFDENNREYRIVNFDVGWLGLGVPSTIPLKPDGATYCIRSYVGKFSKGTMLLTCVPDDITEMNQKIPGNVRQEMLDGGYEWRLKLAPVEAANKQLEVNISLLNPKITAKPGVSDNGTRYLLVKDKTEYVSVSDQRLRRATVSYKINCFPEICGR